MTALSGGSGVFGKQPLVAGVDEAGRGPLAGPVVAAAVILDLADPIPGLNDSKKLTPKRRDALYLEIRQRALAWAIAPCSAADIDQHNIFQATMLAMRQAVVALPVAAHMVLVDGNQVPVGLPAEGRAIVGGDGLEPAIGAASILAKVYRDRCMAELDLVFPAYGFARHKGYPTPQHLRALAEHGPCPEHRRSFAPVREALSVQSLPF
ncbi:MAG: ribonuclease HII [Ectothiorhodospiraceae bacterium]|nr:ribonuclease HII [Ectothiorhodospiraceae bacterium]MCH8504392.1 ribonuclease HII [Ectothiorhodospiraceae bacterium]